MGLPNRDISQWVEMFKIDRMAWASFWLEIVAILLLLVCAAALIILVRTNLMQESLNSINRRITNVEKTINEHIREMPAK